jgi:predicted AAA+ superfamily ATPase
MKQIINFLKTQKNISDKNIIYVNLEIDYLKFKNIDELNIYIKSQIENSKNDKRFYLFLDEIQEIN